MVDVGSKPVTRREAAASGEISVSPAVAALLRSGAVPKGDVHATARVAGILAAKRVDELIPLCHTLALDAVEVSFEVLDDRVVIRAEVRTEGRTGVEMEALTAVQVALLTIYDMCKAADRGMVMTDVRLLEKQGGKSGHWVVP